MKMTLVIMALLGLGLDATAACYRLSSAEPSPALDTICLDGQGNVSFFENNLLIFSYATAVQFEPAHEVYRQGKVEGHWYHVAAANHFSNLDARPRNSPGPHVLLDARIPIVTGTNEAHGGCTGMVWFDTKARYCFFPDDPISK